MDVKTSFDNTIEFPTRGSDVGSVAFVRWRYPKHEETASINDSPRSKFDRCNFASFLEKNILYRAHYSDRIKSHHDIKIQWLQNDY